MRAGACLGVDRTGPGACVNPHQPGVSVNWRMPAQRWTRAHWAWFGPSRHRVIESGPTDSVVCPYCLTNRMAGGDIRRGDLNALVVSELRECCQDFGLPSNGNKSTLVDRILDDGPQGDVIAAPRAVAMREHFDQWNCVHVPEERWHTHRVNTDTVFNGADTPCDDGPPADDDEGY